MKVTLNCEFQGNPTEQVEEVEWPDDVPIPAPYWFSPVPVANKLSGQFNIRSKGVMLRVISTKTDYENVGGVIKVTKITVFLRQVQG